MKDGLGAFCEETLVTLKGAAAGPLSGLDFGAKDVFDIAGHKSGCGNPDWLADALEKIHRGTERIDNLAAEGNPATAHMFIVNPLHTHARDKLFSTHPSLANRVARLRAMASQGGDVGKNYIANSDSWADGPWSSAGPDRARRRAKWRRGPWES